MLMSLPTADILRILAEGTLETEGLVPWGSNYTFLMTVCDQEQEHQAIYKPRQGERPLWDFASGSLCLRERAAYLLSEALAWQIVPPTILREGPRGMGSLQAFIPHDPEENFFNFQNQPEFQGQLQRIALFDIFTNNADRKGGHVIRDDNDHLWGIDHGICFHTEYKLRSVIWDFVGQPIATADLADMAQLAADLQDATRPWVQELQQLISQREIKALGKRLSHLLTQQTFITPGPGRHYPWPLV